MSMIYRKYSKEFTYLSSTATEEELEKALSKPYSIKKYSIYLLESLWAVALVIYGFVNRTLPKIIDSGKYIDDVIIILVTFTVVIIFFYVSRLYFRRVFRRITASFGSNAFNLYSRSPSLLRVLYSRGLIASTKRRELPIGNYVTFHESKITIHEGISGKSSLDILLPEGFLVKYRLSSNNLLSRSYFSKVILVVCFDGEELFLPIYGVNTIGFVGDGGDVAAKYVYGKLHGVL